MYSNSFCLYSQKYKGDNKRGKWDKEEGEADLESGAESSLSPSEAACEGDDNTPKVDPLKWTVSSLSCFCVVIVANCLLF